MQRQAAKWTNGQLFDMLQGNPRLALHRPLGVPPPDEPNMAFWQLTADLPFTLELTFLGGHSDGGEIFHYNSLENPQHMGIQQCTCLLRWSRCHWHITLEMIRQVLQGSTPSRNLSTGLSSTEQYCSIVARMPCLVACCRCRVTPTVHACTVLWLCN